MKYAMGALAIAVFALAISPERSALAQDKAAYAETLRAGEAKIAAIRGVAADLRTAAAIPTPPSLPRPEATEVKKFDDWIVSAAHRVAGLANAHEQKLDDARAPCKAPAGCDKVAVTKQMAEVNFSFNLQYLQLQSQLQHENRAYTAVSNIMKTKHDTVKNSISNVR